MPLGTRCTKARRMLDAEASTRSACCVSALACFVGWGHHQGRQQKGFTLLEVILALGISGMVIGVGVNFYLQSSTMNAMTRSYQIIGDNGSTALAIVGEYIRDAGYGGDSPWSHFNPIEASGEDCAFNNYCSENNVSTSDAIALRLNPATDRACSGEAVEEDEIIINRFYVDETRNVLMCMSFSVTQNAPIFNGGFEIQDGIEQMQIEYLLVDNTVTSDPNRALLEGILGVTVSFLVGSTFDDRLLTQNTRTYRLLDNDPIVFEASREPRQIFQSSFVINSMLVGRR